jgi:serine phosphatase RsbU (regulator of sigma subunit)
MRINLLAAIFAVFVLSFTLISGCKKIEIKEPPKAVNGLLDLTSWNFSKDGNVKLNGKWEFYWDQLLTPDDFNKSKQKLTGYYYVPSFWTDYKDLNLPLFGKATYRIIVNTNLNQIAGLKTPDAYSSKKIWINGKLFHDTIDKYPDVSNLPYRTSEIYTFDNSQKIEIVLQVANYLDCLSGIGDSPELSDIQSIQKNKESKVIFEMFLISICFILGCYHIVFFIFRTKDRASIYLALVCLGAALRAFTTGEYLIMDVFPDMPYWIVSKLTAIPFPFITFCYVLFIYKLFEKECSRKLTFIIASLSFLVLILELLVPNKFLNVLIMMYIPCVIFACLYIIIVSAIAAKHKQEGAVFVLSGFLFVVISFINDVLFYYQLVDTGFYMPIGITVFIFCQLMILALRFNKSFAHIENLTGVLSDLNVNLEKKVEVRTKELLKSNNELNAVMEELRKSKDRLWSEMDLARKIQTILLPKYPYIEGYNIAAYMEPAAEVGGDYYDVINMEGVDWITIGDVSGHGVTAGLIMMMVQTSIRTVMAGSGELKPEAVLRQVNRVFSENVSRLTEDKYMTISVIACLRNGHFYHSGLHQDIMIYREKSREVEIIETNGMWLGLMDNIRGIPRDDEFVMQSGDVMLLYTDGITEARVEDFIENKEIVSNMYGADRLKKVFIEYGGRDVMEIKRGILESLTGYKCRDDVTLLVIKKN